MTEHLAPILVGVIACGSVTAALVFLRFWSHSRDRFFIFFALSFAIEGVNRLILYLSVGANEDAPIYYLVRLVAYGLILAAIIDKNRRR